MKLMNKPQAFRRRLWMWKQIGVYGQSIAHSFWILYIIPYVLLFKVEIPLFFTNNRCWLVTKVTFKPLVFFHEAPAWISGQQPENVRTWLKKTLGFHSRTSLQRTNFKKVVLTPTRKPVEFSCVFLMEVCSRSFGTPVLAAAAEIVGSGVRTSQSGS